MSCKRCTDAMTRCEKCGAIYAMAHKRLLVSRDAEIEHLRAELAARDARVAVLEEALRAADGLLDRICGGAIIGKPTRNTVKQALTSPSAAAATPGTPVAWLHTLDNTDGIPENTPMRTLAFSQQNPFGAPGVDYSKEYPWTATPLFASASPSAAAEVIRQAKVETLLNCEMAILSLPWSMVEVGALFQNDCVISRDDAIEAVRKLEGK